MKPWTVIVICVGILHAGQSFAEDEVAVLHVTSVHSEEAKDWCNTGACSAMRFTVEGYVQTKEPPSSVEYILECVEVLAEKPTPHYTVLCSRVHAHNDYVVKIGADSIFFQPTQKSSDSDPLYAGYRIVSEREIPKRKQ